MKALNYRVKRSNRKSVSLSVLSDCTILVRCPHYLSIERIDEMIDKKYDWLIKTASKLSEKNAENASLLAFKKIYINGNEVDLKFSDVNDIVGNTVFIKSVADVKKLYKEKFSGYLINYANSVSAQVSISATDFCVKAYKSRWGCCDRDDKITLNCLAAMLPEYLQRYLIIHELSHTMYFNHSREYWKFVEELQPDYKLCEKHFKSFDFLLRLYE